MEKLSDAEKAADQIYNYLVGRGIMPPGGSRGKFVEIIDDAIEDSVNRAYEHYNRESR